MVSGDKFYVGKSESKIFELFFGSKIGFKYLISAGTFFVEKLVA